MSFERARRRKWLWIGLLLLAAGLAGFNLLAWRHACAMLRYGTGSVRTRRADSLSLWQKGWILVRGVSNPRPRGRATPSSVGLPFREATIPVTNGISLGAWFCPKKDAGTLAIVFHGYASDKSGTLAEARQLYDLGCAVLLVDFRGSGASTESYTTIGYEEAEDVAAAVAHARREFPRMRVVLFGPSMGAAAVLRAVGRLGVRPDGIILEAVFDTMLHTVRNRFAMMHVPSFPAAEALVFWGGWQMGFDGFAHNPVAYAADVTCPALVMHGRGDAHARLEDGQRVFAQLAGPKRWVEFASVGHESYVRHDREQWRQAVRDFLDSIPPRSPEP
jgi:alpha-beta hydrolase superfamily lysophospholipase